jgi:alpha-D-xyloside xylohydrolase
MGRHLLRLSAAAAFAAASASCGSTPPPNGLSYGVEGGPFRITIVAGGRTIVAQNEDARLRYRLDSGAEHRLTDVISSTEQMGSIGTYVRVRVATDEPGRTAVVTINSNLFTEGRPLVSIDLIPAQGVREIYDSFDVSPDTHFVGGGEVRDRVDLRGAIVPIKVSTDCGYAPVPFFATTERWGLSLEKRDRSDSPRIGAFAFPGSPGGTGCRFGDEPVCTFPPLGDRVEVCQQGSQLTELFWFGTIPRMVAGNVGRIARFGTHGAAPRSQLELIKWRDEVSGPEQVLEDIARFQSAGIPLGWVLVDNPWETCVGSLAFDPARFPDPAGLIREVHARGVRFMLWVSPKVICNPGYPPAALLGDPADQVELDLRDPEVDAAFRAKLRKLVALGIDGVKADRGDEVDLQPIDDSYQNAYPELYARAVMDSLPARSAAMFRVAAKGSAPGLWAGDQDGSFDGLREAIRAGQSASMSGFFTWGSDVGGYRSEKLTEEVFARWAQFGAVSPIMEVGGIGANATPWTLGPNAMPILKAAAILHYELFPYMYGLLKQGQPVLRPLGYAYPEDPEAWKADLEFLVGPDLLAAPVIGPGTTPSVYLPEGSWIDLYAGRIVKGGQVFTRPTPLTEFPLYVRDGAVVPFNLRTADSWWDVNEQTHPGRAGWLATNFANLRLRGQPRDVQIFVPSAERPLSVLLGGRTVPWTWNDGPMPGVVVRLHGPTVRGEIVLSRT